MAYFKQLTGSKLPKKEKFTINYNGKTHIGNMYRVNKFTLRDLSSSKVKGGCFI
jgi:acetylglutamate synthase